MKIKYFVTLLLVGLSTWYSKAVRAQNFTDLTGYKKANSWWIMKAIEIDTTTWSQAVYIADFNPETPVFYPLADLGVGNYAHATAADTTTGELLFFTDSKTIWNNDLEPMPNGTGLMGDGFAGLGACIVEKIGDPGKYYVFTIDAYGTGSLYYSVVDMSLDGGKGDVMSTAKNMLLDAGGLQGSMIAIPGTQCDVWLLVHPYTEPVFRTYHITETGVDPVPVLSYTDSTLYGLGAYISGQIAVSPDRSKIALASNGSLSCSYLGTYVGPERGGALLAEFDPGTGIVFNDTKLSDSACFGVAFSPDGSKLYISDQSHYETSFGNPSDTGRIYQFDVSDYPATAPVLTNTDWLTGPYGGAVQQLRMHPYNGHLLTNTLIQYTNPDASGTASGLDTNHYDWWPDNIVHYYYPSWWSSPALEATGVTTLGNNLVYALPPDTTERTLDRALCKDLGVLEIDMTDSGTSFVWDDGSTYSVRSITIPGKYWVNYLIDACNWRRDTFIVAEYDPTVDLGDDIIGLCSGSQTLLPIVVTQSGMTYLWSDSSTKDRLEVREPGIYWVQTNIKGCIGSDTVEVVVVPKIELGKDIVFCQDDSISPVLLSVQEIDNATYLWSTGAVTNSISVNDTGVYSVSVSIPPCERTDSIRIYREVCECYGYFPTAFSPNADGLNDRFNIVLEPDCPVDEYILSIFNRWGQRVYVGYSPDKGWDGTFNGRQVEAGVYMYEVSFISGTKRIRHYKKGDITLVK